MLTESVSSADHKRKARLPLVDGVQELESLQAFERRERVRLGLEPPSQWVENMTRLPFTRAQSEEHQTTILVCGLTVAHDTLVTAAIGGLGYRVLRLDAPDEEALRYGKEFGNRGQCNPTYFTVGNLVKFLSTVRDQQKLTPKQVIDRYVFLTAGACGPCRFGMYVTEYRKALRDAGFEGFRVLLFQQTGGLAQASGTEPGLAMNPQFFMGIVQALLVGDVLNALGYRVRPYETEAGATDRALERVKDRLCEAFRARKNILPALWSARSELARVPVDRTRCRPKVSIIGEFWAMTTEGDGNYRLQRFLEQEGAEVEVQTVTAWLLYLLWEARHDLDERASLRGADGGNYGLEKLKGAFAIGKQRVLLHAADAGVRAIFRFLSWCGGLEGFVLPDMDEVAHVADRFYSNELRGGEGHMEVGKLIYNVTHAKAHMTLSVKPFGCMPSSGVSDGVQTLVTKLLPGAVFCPVETSGDGAVNFQSRVQMYLFRAKKIAQEELAETCAAEGVTLEQVRTWLAAHPRYGHPLHKAPHRVAGTAADVVREVAPFLTQTRWQRARRTLTDVARQGAKRAASLRVRTEGLLRDLPELAARAREDVLGLWEALQKRPQAPESLRVPT